MTAASQVVYSGAVDSAADYFAGLGYSPSGPSINIADYMLDTVIQAPPEEATRMVIEFKGCAFYCTNQHIVTLAFQPCRAVPGIVASRVGISLNARLLHFAMVLGHGWRAFVRNTCTCSPLPDTDFWVSFHIGTCTGSSSSSASGFRSQIAGDQEVWAARLQARPWALPPAKQQVYCLQCSSEPTPADALEGPKTQRSDICFLGGGGY